MVSAHRSPAGVRPAGGEVRVQTTRTAGGILALTCFLLILAVWSPQALAQARQVGGVNRIQAQATAENVGKLRTLSLGAAVREGDRLRTGPGARLEIQLLDSSLLTLGAETTLTLDSYALDRDRRRGDALLGLLSGAFRLITGVLGRPDADLKVRTPLATIGVRGTDFWGGWLDVHGFGVIMVSGRAVTVSNDVGTATIDQPGFGVMVKGRDEPLPEPVRWKDDKVAAAVSTVVFDPAP